MATDADGPRLSAVRSASSLAGTLAGVVVASAACVVIAPSTPAAAAKPRIGLIGDSTLTGIRAHDAFGPLQRATATHHGRRDPAQPGRPVGSLVVMVMGYNDPGTHFGASIDAVMAEAGRQGTVIWASTAPESGTEDTQVYGARAIKRSAISGSRTWASVDSTT